MFRPAFTPAAVLTHDRELLAGRRTALRMLALAELVGDRTLVAFPLRDGRGIPFDLVLADEGLHFPAARWSDVRQRLGAGRPEPHWTRPAAPAAKRRKDARAEATRHALVVPVDPPRTDLERLRRGELDLGYLRVRLTD
ncbi:hypothetical protein AB0M46_35620 [Dactylosporangium sp. NPDC051485]|uniref:hypothetical protein n=1 Tax=Dactylosporangium sp. NPDC051485 TaxID=3154846 RepID=UPI003443B848